MVDPSPGMTESGVEMLQRTANSDEMSVMRPPGLAMATPKRLFVLLVVAPTLLVLLYLVAFASPQYRSEAQFVVRGMQPEPASTSGLGQLLGVGAGLSGTQKEAQTVREYLLSADAIAALNARKIDIAAIYSPSGADFFSRLRPDRPPVERLLEYYRDKVTVSYSTDDGITRVAVTAFSPHDAQRVAAALIAMGEAQVNRLNQRAIEAGTAIASAELAKAETELADIQGEMTGFRDLTGDIDPARNSEGAQKQIAEQETALSRERALLADMARYLDGSAPQMIAMRSKLQEMERALAATRSRLTGNPAALAKRLARYEELKLRQNFNAKRYDAARVGMENAQAQAAKQRLFLVQIVQPSKPERPVAPRPWRTSLAVFMALAAAFGIIWLLIAGIREHQAG
jgi:capsular polysaccharide transport system permease protein